MDITAVVCEHLVHLLLSNILVTRWCHFQRSSHCISSLKLFLNRTPFRQLLYDLFFATERRLTTAALYICWRCKTSATFIYWNDVIWQFLCTLIEMMLKSIVHFILTWSQFVPLTNMPVTFFEMQCKVFSEIRTFETFVGKLFCVSKMKIT